MASSWVPIASGLAGAAVATGGFLLNGLRGRRESLDKRIERAAKSQIGDRFLDFVDMSERARQDLDTLTKRTLDQAQAAMSEAEARLSQLNTSQDVQSKLEKLLSRAELILPEIDTIAASSPVALIERLSEPQLSASGAAALISELMTRSSANGRQLEKAGDIAREVLDDDVLAREAYSLAIERSPENISAQAELIALDLKGTTEKRQRAQEKLRNLAINNPTVRTPLIKLLNYFTMNDEYEAMESFINSLLEHSAEDASLKRFSDDPLLWRNLALALSHTSDNIEKVKESYEHALTLAHRPDGDGDYVNTARPYSNWLIYQGDLATAADILNRAAELFPMEASIYFGRYRLEIARGDLSKARRSLQVMESLGNAQEGARARMLRMGLDARAYLDSDGPEADGNIDSSLFAGEATLDDVASMGVAPDSNTT